MVQFPRNTGAFDPGVPVPIPSARRWTILPGKACATVPGHGNTATSQLTRGHSLARAHRALANRWVKIIWTLWQRREWYSEAKHAANREQKGQAGLKVG